MIVTVMLDWMTWHDYYDDADSALSKRLRAVQDRVRAVLDAAPPGRIRVISMCAGQGRDLIEVVRDHPRRDDVTARLVELDPRNAEFARQAAVGDVEVVVGDAALTDAYAGAAPADLVLACGIFGNITDEDVRRTIDCLPRLCVPGATVIWTRHTREPDLTPAIRARFAEQGFVETAFVIPEGTRAGVGAHRLVREPDPLRRGVRMFSFVDNDLTDVWR